MSAIGCFSAHIQKLENHKNSDCTQDDTKNYLTIKVGVSSLQQTTTGRRTTNDAEEVVTAQKQGHLSIQQYVKASSVQQEQTCMISIAFTPIERIDPGSHLVVTLKKA
jgi:hypothetical protein